MSSTLIQRALHGDRRSLARAISALENNDDEAHDIRKSIAVALADGHAHVIGVTGPPGGGKSTLVAALIGGLRARERRVAVVAVDPSSPFSGGAVLGDRIRMGAQQADEGVFIRSLASRGHLGGLAAAAGDVIDLFDAAGFDVIIVETVGAGQSEIEITRFADTRVVVCPPGLGDDVQAIKSGILEIADVFVVTKADLPDAERTAAELHAMLALRRDASQIPPLMKVAATSGLGLPALVDWLDHRPQRRHRHAARENDETVQLITRCLANDNVAKMLGFELVTCAKGTVTLRMKIEQQHMNFNGRCHGGIIFALGDMALGLACNSHGKLAALVDGNISIASAVEVGDWLIAHAHEVAKSRKLGSYLVKVTKARDNAHVALLHGTVYVLDKPVAIKA